MRICIPSGSNFENTIGFSRAVRCGPLIAVSGTAPIQPEGAPSLRDDVYLQTKRCIEIGAEALIKAGAGIDDVIRSRILLVDITKWQEAARAHQEVFATVRPACTFYEVSRFIDPKWLVEVEFDAYVLEAPVLRRHDPIQALPL